MTLNFLYKPNLSSSYAISLSVYRVNSAIFIKIYFETPPFSALHNFKYLSALSTAQKMRLVVTQNFTRYNILYFLYIVF